MLMDKKREKSKVLNRVIYIYRLVLRTERSWGGWRWQGLSLNGPSYRKPV